MEGVRLKFQNREFESFDEMIVTLLNEANERILRIDLGQEKNEVEARNEVKFRLMHVERNLRRMADEPYRMRCNSLWSQMYRLEHQDDYSHPYLMSILDRLRSPEL